MHLTSYSPTSQLTERLLATMQAAVIATSLDGTITFWNDYATHLYGWSASEVVGHSISEITVPDSAQADAADIMRLLASGQSWSGEFTVKTKDGRLFTASVTDSPIFDEQHQLIGIVGVSFDLTAAKQSEAELRRSEEHFKRLANALPQLCWIAHRDGGVVWYNDRFFEYTGLDFKQLQDWGWQRLHDPVLLPSVIERWRHSLATFTPFEMEFRLRGSDGALRWFLCRAIPVFDDPVAVSWFGVCTNVDEGVTARHALHQSQRELEERVNQRTAELHAANEHLRQLSAHLMESQDEERRRLARELHDSLGQLIAAASIYLDKARRHREQLPGPSASALDEVSSLIGEMGRQTRTISHLLHPPLLDEVGLLSALRLFSDEFSARSGVRVELDICSDLGRASADLEIAVFRIVQECLTNIHRHSGSPVALIQVQHSDGQIRLRVADRGAGIPADQLKLLNSAHLGGVGFRGMRERVRKLGGVWQVASDSQGTEVSVSLPFVPLVPQTLLP
ncbi:MAG TPA: PAS domain S-box protein [Candidatus Acidoferrum sp.]|nr:PAS domain S-box protein [Candidatus Acidoferrum sp.]